MEGQNKALEMAAATFYLTLVTYTIYEYVQQK